MKQLRYQISIHASVQEVWNTVLQPDTYKDWVAVSWPGSFYTGNWEKDASIRFISHNGSGTLARIKDIIPYNKINAEHIAVLHPGGIEDSTSDLARGWTGTTEQYMFTERNNETVLQVDIHTHPAWESMFDRGWPAALQQLKMICEKNHN